MPVYGSISTRPLERSDLRFIHELNYDYSIMAYWFEEPYESYDELEDLYNKHIHDDSERRFIAGDSNNHAIGLVALMEINYIHRNAKFQIIISPNNQGKVYARPLIHKALDYSFSILNLHKVYLNVAAGNEKAIHIYEDCGFSEDGVLKDEFFINGKYTDVKRMFILQNVYFIFIRKTDFLPERARIH